jgi:hypothetical protein
MYDAGTISIFSIFIGHALRLLIKEAQKGGLE